MTPRARPGRQADPNHPQRLAVLAAARRLLARGELPTVTRLAREAGAPLATATRWRSFVADGALELPHIRTGPKLGQAMDHGRTGATPAERDAIADAYLDEWARKQTPHDDAPSALRRARVARVGRYCGPAVRTREVAGRDHA